MTMTNNREEQIYKAADKATYQTPPQYSELVHKSRKVMSAYEVGFIDGCVWADSHPHWISVEDELPKENGRLFLVCVKDGKVCESAYDVEDDIWYRQSGTVLNPTHWMPMPQPSRKEE